DAAHKLHQRDILYAPDYVVNAGGAMGLTMFNQGAAELEIYRKIEGIETTLTNIFRRAARLSQPPLCVADELVRQILAEARAKRPAPQSSRSLGHVA
ncbi:MAG TPA: hypothetical protein VKD91_01695, partial [Pyrinomonadaceae bacterium]|nr:hypothetical protein [Pyrinomonadaceae bacterium]